MFVLLLSLSYEGRPLVSRLCSRLRASDWIGPPGPMTMVSELYVIGAKCRLSLEVLVGPVVCVAVMRLRCLVVIVLSVLIASELCIAIPVPAWVLQRWVVLTMKLCVAVRLVS